MIEPTNNDVGREVVLDYEATANAGNALKAQVPGWRGIYLGSDLSSGSPGYMVRVQTKDGIFTMTPAQLNWALRDAVRPAERHQMPPYGERAVRLRGAAALTEMLSVIGDDTTVARLLVDNELELRALLRFAIKRMGR